MGDDARRYLFFVNIQLELDLHLCNGNDTKICKIKTEIHREKKGGFRCLAFNNILLVYLSFSFFFSHKCTYL